MLYTHSDIKYLLAYIPFYRKIVRGIVLFFWRSKIRISKKQNRHHCRKYKIIKTIFLANVLESITLALVNVVKKSECVQAGEWRDLTCTKCDFKKYCPLLVGPACEVLTSYDAFYWGSDLMWRLRTRWQPLLMHLFLNASRVWNKTLLRSVFIYWKRFSYKTLLYWTQHKNTHIGVSRHINQGNGFSCRAFCSEFPSSLAEVCSFSYPLRYCPTGSPLSEVSHFHRALA